MPQWAILAKTAALLIGVLQLVPQSMALNNGLGLVPVRAASPCHSQCRACMHVARVLPTVRMRLMKMTSWLLVIMWTLYMYFVLGPSSAVSSLFPTHDPPVTKQRIQ